jgi:uncharacterized protein YyaL (SSP411 family)
MANRLAGETSPYLLQHKDNPVDWHPWGDDALDEAKKGDKPILLSIGYAACHWCHVMERESFEDEETARLMNQLFVPIKVDREERPDIDAIYMEAVQAMTGHGGWPMTVFLTPEGVPFYGGTYFPPEPRHGMPSFKQLLLAIADEWAENRERSSERGGQILQHMGAFSRLPQSSEPITGELLVQSVALLERAFDPRYGGFGGAPKFPQPMTVDFLLRMSARGHATALKMATVTLDAMAAGGMFDQLGGGFARYSVDAYWVVPHFEKMLYDNAGLIRTYARAWQVTRSERYREVVERTVGWLTREMRDPFGGFFSSLDADSEGEEGKFYVWTIDEVRDVLGTDADAAIERWGLTEQGNFEGKNIPVDAKALGSSELEESMRARLLARREERVRPGADTKVLAGWNALTASALAQAGAASGREDWVEIAREIMRFILGDMRVDGRLMRTYRTRDDGTKGDVRVLGYAEDYAMTLEACLALFEATGEGGWLDEARWAADESIRLFWDEDSGGFFTTGIDAPELVTRPKDHFDNAIPAANSVFAVELQRLALITGDERYERSALAPIRALIEVIPRSPQGFGHLLAAVDLYTGNPAEVVIVGGDEADRRALLDVTREGFHPNSVLISPSDESTIASSALPVLEGRLGRREATAFVCHRGVCELPVTTADALRDQLTRA